MPRRTAHPLDTEDDLYAAAVTALARRAHSVHEMKRFLERRAANASLAPLVLARLKDRGMLDDARYARQFARDHAANRRQGPFRIARELRARGVPDLCIDAALKELADETDPRENLRRRIRSWLRRHGAASPAALDRQRAASLYHSLLRAGFSGERIRAELSEMGKASEDIHEDGDAEE